MCCALSKIIRDSVNYGNVLLEFNFLNNKFVYSSLGSDILLYIINMCFLKIW